MQIASLCKHSLPILACELRVPMGTYSEEYGIAYLIVQQLASVHMSQRLVYKDSSMHTTLLAVIHNLKPYYN